MIIEETELFDKEVLIGGDLGYANKARTKAITISDYGDGYRIRQYVSNGDMNWQRTENIPMQLPVGMPSETLSCELNGIKKGLGAIESEARRQRRLAETFKVNDDSWKFHTTKAHYYEDALRVIETNKNFYIKNLASKP